MIRGIRRQQTELCEREILEQDLDQCEVSRLMFVATLTAPPDSTVKPEGTAFCSPQ